MSRFGEYQGVPFIDANEANRPTVRQKVAPKIDKEVSQAVGFSVPVNNPKLIKLVAQWKRKGGLDETPNQMDNFLKDPNKISELKRVLSG